MDRIPWFWIFVGLGILFLMDDDDRDSVKNTVVDTVQTVKEAVDETSASSSLPEFPDNPNITVQDPPDRPDPTEDEQNVIPETETKKWMF